MYARHTESHPEERDMLGLEQRQEPFALTGLPLVAGKM